MKDKIADLAFRLGLLKPAASMFRGRGKILMLHEIHADEKPARFDGCSVAQLDWILTALRRWDIDLISMDELLPRLRSENRRQFVAITLDDGYRDNLTNALPVLERYGAPALINVPTGAVTRALYCWWLALRELFMTRDSLSIEPLGRKIEINSLAAKLAEYRRLQSWVAADFTRAEQLRPWLEAEGIDFESLCERYFMNDEELKRCASHPLVTIGAHSKTHRPLASLSDADLQAELCSNKAFLEDCLQKPVDHFAYPFGGAAQCGPREASAARAAGFKTAIAVRRGQFTLETPDNPFLLPREDAGYCGMTERHLYGVVNGLYGLRARFTNA